MGFGNREDRDAGGNSGSELYPVRAEDESMTAGNVGRKSLDGFARSPTVHLIAVPRLNRLSTMPGSGCRLNPCGGPGGNSGAEQKLELPTLPPCALPQANCQDDDLEDYEEDWDAPDMEE